ncbi:DUF4870 domain-containing protein [Candidatus Oleimmundimicrobium sp.]|uniref:DUF4870 domain-containing protein n=1 Tax=Candidatus Oleimmundimicrobium sp. TaxID=3060597 RepID=UPI0027215846|nr:DUF4870 domain-containing protein [Candidatus Oleimmundimicrobium sp.]MDO8886563.1 DUF4870 domain-containing protein [Candidatus Oleimmundimicrobium sp.]
MEQGPVTPSPQTSSTGMDPKVAALLSYLFGWVSGLIFFLIEKEDKYVRFHAMQSILLSVACIVIMIALNIILGILMFVADIFGIFFAIVSPLFSLAFFVLWIMLMVKAYQGEKWKLPIIGDMAEKYA